MPLGVTLRNGTPALQLKTLFVLVFCLLLLLLLLLHTLVNYTLAAIYVPQQNTLWHKTVHNFRLVDLHLNAAKRKDSPKKLLPRDIYLYVRGNVYIYIYMYMYMSIVLLWGRISNPTLRFPQGASSRDDFGRDDRFLQTRQRVRWSSVIFRWVVGMSTNSKRYELVVGWENMFENLEITFTNHSHIYSKPAKSP